MIYAAQGFLFFFLIEIQCILGNASALTNESLDPSSEEWLAECFNDTEMNFNTDDVYASLDLDF